MAIGKKNKENQGEDASGLMRLSPPDIFETLLGEPAERGYDEEALKRKIEKSRDFACNRTTGVEGDK